MSGGPRDGGDGAGGIFARVKDLGKMGGGGGGGGGGGTELLSVLED